MITTTCMCRVVYWYDGCHVFLGTWLQRKAPVEYVIITPNDMCRVVYGNTGCHLWNRIKCRRMPRVKFDIVTTNVICGRNMVTTTSTRGVGCGFTSKAYAITLVSVYFVSPSLQLLVVWSRKFLVSFLLRSILIP